MLHRWRHAHATVDCSTMVRKRPQAFGQALPQGPNGILMKACKVVCFITRQGL